MAEAERFITFVCGYCEQPIKAPAESEGRVGKCPNCKQPVIAPQFRSADEVFASNPFSDASCGPRKRMRELFHGMAVSLVLHAILVSVLAVMIIKSPELGRTILVTLFLDTDGTEVVKEESPAEARVVILAPADGEISLAGEGTAAGNRSTKEGVPGGTGTGTASDGRALRMISSNDPNARLSPTATDRLSRQPAAKRGDYEIALFWDGPSDLDVHVRVLSRNKRIPDLINYVNKGTPATGFLVLSVNFGDGGY